MPFNADIRAGLFSVELNISSIVEELENLVEKTLDISQDYEKGGVVWKYVYDLENDYSAHMNSKNSPVNFWEWFTDNYNNVYSYEDLIWEEEDKYIVRFERAVYGGEHGTVIGTDCVVAKYATLQEAREAYDSYEVQDIGELLYLLVFF